MGVDANKRIAWHSIQPLEPDYVPKNGSLAALDALREEWVRYLGSLSETERKTIRQRSLRRLAIETGILERLYEIDWGLTLSLIAEGFTRDVIERAGGHIDDRTRATLEAQRDGLEMVMDFVASGRPLSAGFIKELHAAITRTQDTYIAKDSLGRVTEVPLGHGLWKTQANHVELADGRILEYAPPEHVGSEIDRLVTLFSESEASRVHPIPLAAWLHHRFVQIHPFADGNGRVGRALVLLVLQKHRFAPLVVDRFHRDAYLTSLNSASAGDLLPLVKLFTKLESSALAGELEAPHGVPGGVSIDIAHTLAAQIRAARDRNRSRNQQEMHVRALAVGARISDWFNSKESELRQTFLSEAIRDARVDSDSQMGSQSPRHYWFRKQIVEAARRAGHYADFGPDSGWTGLRLRVGGIQLRYVAALHGAGQDAGVLAVVTFGELETLESADSQAESRGDRELIETSEDAFRVVHTEPLSAIDERAGELVDLLDEGLSIALVKLLRLAR